MKVKNKLLRTEMKEGWVKMLEEEWNLEVLNQT